MNRVFLVGNPNSGKTTLFNALTGRRERVGNYAGVTVNAPKCAIKGTFWVAVDLPGTYSLTPYGGEERVTGEAVAGADAGDLIVNVIEARTAARAISLTREIKKLGKPTVVAITLEDELEKFGGAIDRAALSNSLGVPVMGADELAEALKSGGSLRDILNKPNASGEGRKSPENVKSPLNRALNATFNREKTLLKGGSGDGKASLPEELKGAFLPPEKMFTKLDRVLLRPAVAIPLFAAVMGAVFYLTFGTFGPGKLLGGLMLKMLEYIAAAVGGWNFLGNVLPRLLSEGVIGGLAAVVSFVPQLAVMYLAMIFLEESGYLARAAFVFNGAFEKVGLSGKAVFPILLGFGCTATAAVATRTAENKALARRTALALHFLPCSARMPVLMLVLTKFFPGKEFAAVVIIYAAGILLGALASSVAFSFEGQRAEPFAMELPPMRRPRAKVVLSQLAAHMSGFAAKACTTLLAVSVLLWLLRSFSPTLSFLNEGQISMSVLAKIGGALGFLFWPMGICGWQIPVAALSGLVAKESVVSALALVYPNGPELSPASALAFVVFVAFYTPCVMTASALTGEFGRKTSAFLSAFSLINGLLCGYVAYFLATLAEKGLGIFIALAVAGGGILFIIINKFALSLRHRRSDDKVHGAKEGAARKAHRAGRRALLSRDEAHPRPRGKAQRQADGHRRNVRNRGLN